MIDIMGMKDLVYPGKVAGYLKGQVKNATWSGTLINLIIALAISVVVSLVSIFLSTAISGALSMFTGTGLSQTAASGAMNLAFLATSTVLGFIGFFVTTGIFHLISKALGGNGKYVQFAYLSSIIGLASSLVGAVLTLLGLIPFVSCLMLPVFLVIWVYSIYLYYKSIVVVYGLEKNKAIIAYVVGMVVLLVLYAIVFGVLFLLGFASMFGLGVLTGGLPSLS